MKEIPGDISGHNMLGLKDLIAYLPYNFIRGIAGYSSFVKTKYLYFKELEGGKNFPCRKHMNQFLTEYLPKVLPIKEIDMLDIGCGSGYPRGILSSLGYSGIYTGLDISKHKNFDKRKSENFKSVFVLSKIEDFETNKKFDLILSVGALEHIENDKAAISKSNLLLKPMGVQIHIVPSFWSLFLFLWHGYRQYGPKRLKLIFGKERSQVFRLGGLFSFFLHLLFITIPTYALSFPVYVLSFFTSIEGVHPYLTAEKLLESSVYPKLVNICNNLDRFLPFCSTIYVVVTKQKEKMPSN